LESGVAAAAGFDPVIVLSTAGLGAFAGIAPFIAPGDCIPFCGPFPAGCCCATLLIPASSKNNIPMRNVRLGLIGHFS
jgi:hypothetical protein